MHAAVSGSDRVLHLALYVAAAAAFAVVALALLERVGGAQKRSIRALHIVITIAAATAIGVAERVYHLVR